MVYVYKEMNHVRRTSDYKLRASDMVQAVDGRQMAAEMADINSVVL